MNISKKYTIKFIAYTFVVVGMIFFSSSCKKKGCMDSSACNYSSAATKDDGTCNYGCNTSSSSSSSSSSGGGLCTNTCSYAYDGVCDDGGAGSSYNVCDYGSDCADCGTRYGTSSSSSGSSSSSSGSTSSGKVTFYTQTDLGCGTITVTVSGQGSQYISSYYSSGISGCDKSGCANFTLPPGTYSYSASCSGYNWGPTSFTVTANGCLKYQLY